MLGLQAAALLLKKASGFYQQQLVLPTERLARYLLLREVA